MSELTNKEIIDGYIERARKAQAEFEKLSQEQVDLAVKTLAKTIHDNAEYFAEISVEETGMGNVPDKIVKCRNKSRNIWYSLKGKPSRGIIKRDPETGITEIAKPVGVVAAITPCTNPIVTPMSNAMFALKCGNAIVFTPHHKAVKCSTKAVEMMNEALAKLNMPENLIQIIKEKSRDNTKLLISAADVVVATGGMGMVNAAYSSGKPALGVGTGNVQCIIDKDADIAEAVPKIIKGRAYDNGIICSAEQSVIAPKEKLDEVLKEFEKNKAYVIREEKEKTAFRNALFVDGAINRHAIGQSPKDVAALANIKVPDDTSLIVVVADGRGDADAFSREKIAPVLSAYSYDDFKDAVEVARANLDVEGTGHSVSIHSNTTENIEYAGNELNVSRFVINQVCAASAGGSFQNGLAPTNTLGCGTWGNNSISENLTYKHLMNVSRIAYFMPDNYVPSDEELWS